MKPNENQSLERILESAIFRNAECGEDPSLPQNHLPAGDSEGFWNCSAGKGCSEALLPPHFESASHSLVGSFLARHLGR
jgi:hypothetical protein